MLDHMFLRDRSKNPNHGDLNKKEVISFRAAVAPNTTNTIFREQVKADGTVEKVSVRFYPGQQMSLHVFPFISHKGDQTESLVTYPKNTNNYLAGDDDYLVFDMVATVEYLDWIEVMVSNVDPANTYTLVVDVVVDYYGGKQRVV